MRIKLILKALFADIRVFLSKSYFIYIAVIFSLFLLLPSLNQGFFLDDWLLKLKIKYTNELNWENFNFGIFDFVGNNSVEVKSAVDDGSLPWWTYEKLRMSFWRPLTELTHFIEFRLWPDSPFFMHWQNLIWYGIILLIAGILYKRFLGYSWIAGLAIFLFAIESTHAVPVAWISNRNALIAVFFGLTSLYFHDRWRRDNFKPGWIFSAICFIFCLLSAEFGLGIFAYLFAYAVCLENKGIKIKILSILPYAGIFVIWSILYKLNGYGVYGSGVYIDPGNEPVRFFWVLIRRLPVLLHGQMGLFGTGFYRFLPS